MKRVISAILVCIMLVMMIPVSVFAETTEIASGTCGNDLIWVLTEDGTLAISGTGEMRNCTDSGLWVAPWHSYCSSITQVVIEDGVTSIGEYAFYECTSLTTVTIGNGVTEIGTNAFRDCTSLTSIDISDSVAIIGNLAFYGCSSLTSIDIPDSVTIIGKNAYCSCTSLTNIMIPNSVTSIADGTFWNCPSLISIEIPDSITSIGHHAFYGCSSLTSIDIPDSVTSIGNGAFGLCANLTGINIPDGVSDIGVQAFYDCTSLTEITFCGDVPSIGSDMFYNVRATSYYPAGNETWTSDVMQDYGGTITWVPYGSGDSGESENDPQFLEITGLSVDKKYDNFYIFLGDSHVYNMDSPDSALHLDLNAISLIDDAVLTPADITWTSSDESIFKIISSGISSDVYVNLRVEGLTEGTATLTATNPDGETLSFEVTVVKPNTLAFTNIYDTKQYYHAGAFYSAASSISDSVEIFVQFENTLIDGYPCEVEADLVANISDVAPITLTATVSGEDLSFDRYSYQNTYSATYDSIAFGDKVYDLLTLFPYGVDSFQAGSTYTVQVTLESESFDAPVAETYSFAVYDAETQRVDEHISFANSNAYYKVSKQNIYGESMLELKDDPEYNWSVVTSLDFDNYYEIVLADILVGMLDVYQTETSIVPAILKDWHGTYKSLLGDVTTMVNDSYSDVLDVGEMQIDKVLKVSKYTKSGDGIYADDDVYQVVLDMFGNVDNVDKIQNFFAAVDDTKSVFSMVSLTGDLVKDFVTWGNSIAVLNAFAETDENFKQVFRHIADNIPDSEKKMKEAIEDYLNYSQDFAGQFSEIYDSFCGLGMDVALDAFEGIVGDKLWDWAAAKAVGWIGKIPISGGAATFSTTTAYTALTTAIGSVTTGVSLGLCLSDLICDSSDKATEMSKIIAMSEFAPYIIQTLEYYEDNLYTAADNNAVDLFERAFSLHKASQSYIMEHTVSALQVKADSILQTILGNDDYDELVADILVQKNAIDSMECCGALADDTIVQITKVIAIKCPVDVYVYNENGAEIVKIIDDSLESAASGISVYIQNGAKFIALPSTQVYSVKIIATDDGNMDYIVMEFDDASQLVRRLEECTIPLATDRVFIGEVVEELGVEPESYALSYESTEYVPTEPEHTHSYTAPIFNWHDDNTCIAIFTCVDGDDTRTVDCIVTIHTVPATETEAGQTVYTATVDFDGQTYKDEKTVEIPATGHVNHITTLVSAVDSTCEHEGNSAYYTCSGCQDWFWDASGTDVIADKNSVVIPTLGHAWIDATCTEPKTCSTCGANEDAALGHSFGEWTKVDATTERRDCINCDHYETRAAEITGNRIIVSAAELDGANTVWIDGVAFPVEYNGNTAYINVGDRTVFMMSTFTYHNADSDDVHTQYPTAMKVWKLIKVDGTYSAQYIPEFEDLLQYSGSSIRIKGVKGIRMITSIDKDKKNALTGSGLAGYKLVEYGTLLAQTSKMGDGPLVLGMDYSKSNYAYKKGVADPIFASTSKTIQYTNVLVGFNMDQCKEDIAMRPYMIVENAQGTQFTIYGGVIYRSIGYIAYQNRNVFSAGTASYNYVWEIIHHVYGNKYDADYKG